MAFNPFRAVANAFSGAVNAVRRAVGGTVNAVREAVAPAPAPAREPTLPKFEGGVARDERTLGPDSPVSREMDQVVADFISDHGGLAGFDADTRAWLEAPTISGPFSEYWVSGGFSADKVLEGMTSISNIQIRDNGDGTIGVSFDYEAEVDGYEIAGHAGS